MSFEFLYKHSRADAVEMDELERWKLSYKANCECKEAIEKAGVTPDMSVSEIGDKLKAAMVEIEASGLTSAKMTWDASGEPNKEPKAVVIKDGAYVSAQ